MDPDQHGSPLITYLFIVPKNSERVPLTPKPQTQYVQLFVNHKKAHRRILQLHICVRVEGPGLRSEVVRTPGYSRDFVIQVYVRESFLLPLSR